MRPANAEGIACVHRRFTRLGEGGERRIDRRNNLDYEDISYLWDDVSRVPRP